MRKLIALFTLLSVNALADCTVSDGTKTYKVPEKTTLSLFEKGRSLSTHKVQDQDGLGTCYANATTAVLKSVYPNHPDFSYLHAASSSATRGWDQEFNKSGQKYVQPLDGSEYVSGGYICNTVAAMKKAGGACPKSKSILESQTGVDSYIQQRLLKGVGRYFDHLNEIKKDPGKYNELLGEVQSAFEIINLESRKIKLECETEKLANNPVSDVFRKVIAINLAKYTAGSESCAQNRVIAMKKLISSESIISKDRILVKLEPKFLQEFSDLLDNDTELSTSLKKFYSSNSASFGSEETQKFLQKLNQFFLSKVPADGKDVNCNDPATVPEHSFILGLDPEAAAINILQAMRDAKNRDCKDVLVNNDAILQILSANEAQACLEPETFKRMLGAIVPLASVGAMLNNELYANLTDPNSTHAFQLTNAIMPGCNKKENLLPMNNVSCASFSMCDQSEWIDYENNTYTGPKGKCYSPQEAEFITRMKVVNSLRAGKAMGVSVCTAFMEDPNARTDFCRKTLPGVAGHSYHAMAISGYRCENGKIQYEILNSWGQVCPTKDGKSNEAITCDLNKDGLPNGRFWIKEEVLVDSITNLTAVNVKK